MNINNQLVTRVSLEKFTELDGQTFVIRPVDDFQIHSVDNRVIGYAGNHVNLDLFDVPASSREIVDYWWEVQHDGLPVNAVIQQLLMSQAEAYAHLQTLPAFSPYTDYVELVGLMQQLDRKFAVDGFDNEFEEITEQISGKLNSTTLYPDDSSSEQYLRRFNIGIPELKKTAKNFSSELRFARELARMGLHVEFKQTGGVDMIVESDRRVEVTRKGFDLPMKVISEKDQQFLDMDLEERTTSIASAAGDAFQQAKGSIQSKVDERNPDIVAVDVSSRLAGFELIAHRCFNNARIFDFEKNFEEALNASEDGPIGFLYFYGRSINPFIGALPPIAWPT